MPPPFRPATAAAGLLTLAAFATNAQQQQETAEAEVHKNALAVAPFSDAIVNRLRVPAGFKVNVFASNLGKPRMMEVSPEGVVYVTRRDEGDVIALLDADNDGKAELRGTLVSGLKGVHGIAQHGGWLYLASSTTIWRNPLTSAGPQPVVTGLPDGGQHPNRMVRFGPDGNMYVSVGSSCNDCAEENQLERATMIRYTPDGQHRRVIANGLRNTIGYDWNPSNQALWGMDHGSDFRGDQTPPEELNRIQEGRNYGWPICYADRQVDAMTNAQPSRMALQPNTPEPIGRPITRQEYCAATTGPVLTTTPHSAPMAMRFYPRNASGAARFQGGYADDAYVAMRGSWNREDPVGYKVLRVRFEGAQAVGMEDFLTGFVDAASGVVYGRPVGIAIARDGALLVSDDTNGVIYRIAYTGR